MKFLKRKKNDENGQKESPPQIADSVAGTENNNSSKNKVSPALLFLKKLFNGVSDQEKINFARHLAVSIKTGMPLLEALNLIKEQTDSKKFRKIIDAIIHDVNNGQFLAQSLERFQFVFGDFFINLVKVGETSGSLSSSLLYVAQELKKQREINQKVRSAMVYPAVILVATLGITLFLTLFIFPKILPIFESLRVDLPITTRAVIFSLNFMKSYGVLAVAGGIILAFVLRIILTLQKVHFLFDRLMLKIPFVSLLITNLTLANFSRSLGVLLKSGMTIVDSLDIAKGTFHNAVYRREVEKVAEGVRRGESMARGLHEAKKFFPPLMTGMIRVGETTGNLEENLEYLAEYYESEVKETVERLTTVIEPVLLIFMGVLVGFIALSIITPIYKITQGLKIK